MFCLLAKAKGAEQFVHFFELGAEDFGEAAGAEAAQHFHLEEAVLGVDVAHGPIGVGGILGVDVGDAVFIEDDFHFLLQPGEFGLAFVFGSGALEIYPETEDEDEQKGNEGEQDAAETFHVGVFLHQR